MISRFYIGLGRDAAMVGVENCRNERVMEKQVFGGES